MFFFFLRNVSRYLNLSFTCTYRSGEAIKKLGTKQRARFVCMIEYIWVNVV